MASAKLVLFSILAVVVIVSDEFLFSHGKDVGVGTLTAEDHKCWNGITDFARICYFTDGSIDRPGKGKYGPEDIDPKLCTHVLYAFAILDETSLDKIKPGNPKSAYDLGFFKKITSLKSKGVTVMLSVGGWGESTDKYSKMMNDVKRRGHFVEQVSSFLSEHGFQGLDVDLEYPCAWNGEPGTGLPEDKENFVKLLRELRKKFDEDHQKGVFVERPILSAAVTGRKRYVDAGYDVPAIAQVCDWVGVMSYDIYNQANNRTGLVAPFSLQPGSEGRHLQSSVQAFVNYWLEKGAPAEKLVVGFPFYGRPFKLVDKNSNGLNAPTDGYPDEPSEFTNSTGDWAFYEILDNKLKKGWTTVHYNYLGSSGFKDNVWVGYDDKFDVAVKAEYIRMNCFFGGMVWALDLDCFQRDCPGGPYPLLTTLNEVLTGVKTRKDVQNIT